MHRNRAAVFLGALGPPARGFGLALLLGVLGLGFEVTDSRGQAPAVAAPPTTPVMPDSVEPGDVPPDPADPVRERPEPEPPAFLRDVFVYVTARPDSLTIGDRAVLEVVVEAPAGVEVLFPPGNPLPSRRIDVRNFEVRDPQAKQTQAVEWVGEYEVSIYAVGEVVLPPWPVQVRQGGIEAIARSDSVRFFVGSVLDDSLAAAGIADLKPQEEVPVPPPWRTLFWIAALVVLAVLMYGFWRSRRHEEVVQLPPPRPAHEVALAELRKLETLRLPFDGKIKQHYMALSEILRTYLENAPRFRVHALEETTYEILQELKTRRFDDDVVQRLAAMCEEADLVKFAKHQPTIDACSAALEETRSFVLDTSKTAAPQSEAEPILAAAGDGAAASTRAVPAAAGAGNAPSSGAPAADRESAADSGSASSSGSGNNGARNADTRPPRDPGKERW